MALRGNSGNGSGDFDRDSLHIFPLSMIPLETRGLQRARMIKNSRLESVVELFEGEEIGSGQIRVDELGMVFQGIASSDSAILGKLAKLHSYDVYSLRITLREAGVTINNHDDLKLSERKQKELNALIKHFTRQLILLIYGDDDITQDDPDLIALFRHQDAHTVREKLSILSQKLGIELEEVPGFLEDYGDTFLSITYYRDCLNVIEPTLLEFFATLEDIRGNSLLQKDPGLLEACTELQSKIRQMVRAVTRRFDIFEYNAENLWAKISGDRFRTFRRETHTTHTTLGGILCALTVKMDSWSRKFPNRSTGGPQKRADFIAAEMIQDFSAFELS
jgi:hypothetical protein